jgi:hypothetical protein
MNIKGISTKNKPVLVSFETWQKLRTAAFHQNTKIKTVFENIMSGEINPVTMEPLQ